MEEMVSALVEQSQAYTQNVVVCVLTAVVGIAIMIWIRKDIKRDEEARDAVWADRIAIAFKIHDSK